MAKMESAIDFEMKLECWQQDKWGGKFSVRWIFVKDIPNSQLRHICLSNNDGKSVTNSRDTQEVLLEPGKEMLQIFANYKHKTSILDDFGYYDDRQDRNEEKKKATKKEGDAKPKDKKEPTEADAAPVAEPSAEQPAEPAA